MFLIAMSSWARSSLLAAKKSKVLPMIMLRSAKQSSRNAWRKRFTGKSRPSTKSRRRTLSKSRLASSRRSPPKKDQTDLATNADQSRYKSAWMICCQWCKVNIYEEIPWLSVNKCRKLFFLYKTVSWNGFCTHSFTLQLKSGHYYYYGLSEFLVSVLVFILSFGRNSWSSSILL